VHDVGFAIALAGGLAAIPWPTLGVAVALAGLTVYAVGIGLCGGAQPSRLLDDKLRRKAPPRG
jgi:hypothetical protein